MPKRHVWLSLGGILFLILLIYARSLLNDFVYWDDPQLVLENPISQGMSLWHITQAFTHYDPDLYVPLTFLSFQFNYLLGGLHPFVYHLTNLLLHMGSAVFTGWIALQISRKSSVALLTALLFAVHPINVEAVAWISARKDVLSSFFFLLSLGCFLHWRSVGQKKWYLGSAVAFALGLLAKVSILGLPLILLITDWYRSGAITKKSLKDSAPFFVLSIVFGIVAMFGKLGGTLSLPGKFLLGCEAALVSLWHLAWPLELSVIYPYTSLALTNADLLLSLLVVLSITVAVIVVRTRFPVLLFSWFWFLLLLAPSFFTAEKGKDLVPDLYLTSDRYVYLAAIGIFFVVSLAFHHARRRSRLLADGGAVVVILVLSVLALLQSLAWRDTVALLTSALARTPDSAIAHNNLGVYYRSRGLDDLAFEQYSAAVAHDGTSDAWFNYGNALLQRKIGAEAIDAFENAIALRPDHALAQLSLGAALLQANRLEESLEHLLIAQTLDPGNVVIYLNLGIVLEKQGNSVDARRAYEIVLSLDPENAYAGERLTKIK